MKTLNSEMTKLLDKLYNLRSEDSVVLVSIDKENKMAVETEKKTSQLKTELQKTINELDVEENILGQQGERLIEVLSTIHKEQFGTVIKRLGIDFDPELIKNKVEGTLPATLEKVASEKATASTELVKVEEEMNDAKMKIAELEIRREEAISNQDRLNHYFELSLNSNDNITRDEIVTLLEKFDIFSEEEQREAAKILMFPEDGLFEYEQNRHDKPIANKTIGEVLQAAKKEQVNVEFENIDKGISALFAEEEKEAHATDEALNSVFEVPVVEVPTVEVPLFEAITTPEVTKDTVINLLNEVGLDYLDFSSNDFEQLVQNYDEEVMRDNVSLVKELNINSDVFNDNVELLYDKELKAKVDKLTNVGKLPKDIYLNPNVLVKYSLSELDNAIKVLHESGLEPKNVPLMAY